VPRPKPRRLSLRIERTFDAPLARVWKAWTNRSMLAQWFGDERARVAELDARPGGRLHVIFPPRSDYFGLYLRVKPRRELLLVVVDAPSRWSKTVRATRRGAAGLPGLIAWNVACDSVPGTS